MIATKLKQFLDKHEASYQVLNHERNEGFVAALQDLGLETANAIQSQILSDGLSYLMVVLPADAELDLEKLESELKRHLHCLTSNEVNRLFYDCEPGSHPPIGEAYGLPMVLDSSIELYDSVYFESGCHSSLIHMSMDEFSYLVNDAPRFAIKQNEETHFGCRANPSSHKSGHMDGCKLLFIKGEEPKIQFPELPFSIAEIVPDVLDLDSTESINLYFSILELFSIPDETPMGRNGFLHHSKTSAELMKSLASYIGTDTGTDIGIDIDINITENGIDLNLCFLLGLVHDIGFLIFGHLFAPEFRLLNKWMQVKKNVGIEILEKRLFGMGTAQHVVRCGHAQLGASMLQYWGMPEPLILGVAEHHNEGYTGPYQVYVKLLQLTDHLLKSAGHGDGAFGKKHDEKLLKALGIPLSTAIDLLERLKKKESTDI